MPDALQHARKLVAVVRDRQGTSLQDLKSNLLRLVEQVSLLPVNVDWPERFARPETETLSGTIAQQWPELGYYSAESAKPLDGRNMPEVIGCAADDLLDITRELLHAIQLGEIQKTYGETWLRWSYDVHWSEHANGLLRYLDWESD